MHTYIYLQVPLLYRESHNLPRKEVVKNDFRARPCTWWDPVSGLWIPDDRTARYTNIIVLLRFFRAIIHFRITLDLPLLWA